MSALFQVVHNLLLQSFNFFALLFVSYIIGFAYISIVTDSCYTDSWCKAKSLETETQIQ